MPGIVSKIYFLDEFQAIFWFSGLVFILVGGLVWHSGRATRLKTGPKNIILDSIPGMNWPQKNRMETIVARPET